MALLPLINLSFSTSNPTGDRSTQMYSHKIGCSYLLRICTVPLITQSEYLLNPNEIIIPTFL